MIALAAIPGAGLWAETNLSARSIQRLCRKLPVLFGYPPEMLIIQHIQNDN
jgi:hypothetical protein